MWLDTSTDGVQTIDSLAALLVDVRAETLRGCVTEAPPDFMLVVKRKWQAEKLAEVRRVVEEESETSSYRLVDRILSRLEALK